MASNEKVVLCGIIFDKENAPNLEFLKRMEDGTFFGVNMGSCINDLALIDDYINDGDIFIDFMNKEVWVYAQYEERGGYWIGPLDTKCEIGNFISIEDYKEGIL